MRPIEGTEYLGEVPNGEAIDVILVDVLVSEVVCLSPLHFHEGGG